MFIPRGYDNYNPEKNQAVPSLFNYETNRYMTINSVWMITNNQLLVSDLAFIIKKKTNNNNNMHQDY